MRLRHPQAFALLMLAVIAAGAVLLYFGSLWGALFVLVSGFTLAFVMSMAWLWSPRSGVGRGRRPTHDSFKDLE
jgi:high-affinity Fe2+/Pb2+ permease